MKHRLSPTAKQLAYQKKVADYNDARIAEAHLATTANIIKRIRAKKAIHPSKLP